MSLFEEYLNRGQWLSESERLAIYKYLLKTSKRKYENYRETLYADKTLDTWISNGQIKYTFTSNIVDYKVRKIGDVEWNNQVRTIKIGRIKKISNKKLNKLFAQAELDTIRNYPLPGPIPVEDRSFTMNVFPYYSLKYYSNGKGKIRGIIEKLRSKDDDLLRKLLAS